MRAGHFAGLVFSILMAVSYCAAQAAPKVSASISAQRQKAISLEKQGSLPEAEQAWRAIVKSDSRNAEALAHVGLLAARRENYKDAVSFDRKALTLNPGLAGLRMNLGLALFKGGQPKEAIKEFTRVLNQPHTSPGDAFRLRTLIGMAHYGQGEYSDAIPFLKEAAAADPRNLELRLVLAHSCMAAKQNQCVLDTYKEILSIDPESAEAYILAGEAMDAMGNSTGAIEQFRLAIKANPRQPHAHFGLGYLLWTQKAYDEASKEFQAELALDPDHTQSLLYLGDIDDKAGRFTDARPLLEKAEKGDPSLALAHLDLGIVLTDAGQLDDAVRELKEAARLDPGDVDPHWRLARIYRSRGDTKAAGEELAKTEQLKKAEHEDLYRKMANGSAHPPPAQAPTAQFPPDAPADK
jgi:tetratricopeptide (TPR) repeat protein